MSTMVQAKKLIDEAARQSWGWNPAGKRLTDEQRLNVVRDDIDYRLRDRFRDRVKALECYVDHNGALVVSVIVDGEAINAQYDKPPSPERTMQAGPSDKLDELSRAMRAGRP
jgi:hypothetical protein